MRELNKRGHLVLGVVIGLALAGLIWASGHVWYVPETGYCIGSMVECYSE